MICIKIFRTTSGEISGVSVRGHSGTAGHGEDIVCAGVSALAQTALLGIGQHQQREVDYEVASGDLRMKLRSEPDDLTEAILETMLLGLIEIVKINPEAVRISDSQGVK